jgi:hypothetical protein
VILKNVGPNMANKPCFSLECDELKNNLKRILWSNKKKNCVDLQKNSQKRLVDKNLCGEKKG